METLLFDVSLAVEFPLDTVDPDMELALVIEVDIEKTDVEKTEVGIMNK